MENRKYHYFYKITNQINGKYYYGIHSTNDLNDGYLGSGTHLQEDKKKYGKENFKKDIFKIFKTREEASEYEKKIVTDELVHDNHCYNVKIDGDYGTTVGTILVVDKNDVMHRCAPEDEHYVSGEWVPFGTGRVPCIDVVTNKPVIINIEKFYLNPNRYVSFTKNTVNVKDVNGNVFRVKKDDKRYLSGELVNIWKGRHHSEETKQKMSETHKANKHQQGEKNSQFGTCWITKDGINKKIKKEEFKQYCLDGWVKGRIVIPSEKCFKTQNKFNKEITQEK